MSHDTTHSHIPKTYTIMTIRKEEVGFPNLGVPTLGTHFFYKVGVFAVNRQQH
jgi:hypothetical protein